MCPNSARAASTRRSRSALAPTLAGTEIARPPLRALMCSHTWSQASCLRDETTTFAPCEARASAIDLPIPREDPVTMALFPRRSKLDDMALSHRRDATVDLHLRASHEAALIRSEVDDGVRHIVG